MFYHGSINEMAIGVFLRAQPNGYVQTTEDQELEALMESCRPEDKISRNDAVYFTNDIELIEPLGGYSDFIYEVEPIGDYSRHDLAWYSEAQTRLDNGDMKGAEEAARKYWSGEQFHNLSRSAYEYLCGEAEILEEVW